MDLPHMPWISLALSHHPTVWLAPIIIISCGLTFYFFISICIVCGLVTHSHFQISLGSGGDISYMDQSSISYIFFWIRCNYMYVSGHCGPWPHTYIDYTLAINWKANICSFCLAYMVRCVQKDCPPKFGALAGDPKFGAWLGELKVGEPKFGPRAGLSWSGKTGPSAPRPPRLSIGCPPGHVTRRSANESQATVRALRRELERCEGGTL